MICASPVFEGPALIQLTDKTRAGFSTASDEHELGDLTIDGSVIKSARTVDGIKATGRVSGAYIHDIYLYNIPKDGISPEDNIDGIEAAVRQYPLEGVKKDEAERELGYFLNNAPRMRYHWFRSGGQFVGSGVVEVGCKAVIVL